ncbi:hypothetical protein [Bartonella sp. CB175]|uniref:hypothetical protein n=1 Tax=Bartonella sp. CB175 TaxID=3112256 RepID=UPI00300E6662
MNLKFDKNLLVRVVLRSICIVFTLAILCTILICSYYFIQPRAYRATLTFSISDSMGKSLPICEQNNDVAFLALQPIVLNYSRFQNFFSDGFYKKDTHENIHLFRNGNLINLTFEASTAEAAQYGLKTWFSAFSEIIIKQNQKTSLPKQQLYQQYDNTVALNNIVQEFRSSIDSFIRHNAKQTELNDLYVQLTEATLKRIHLMSQNSTIQRMQENGQSLLSLSFIANNSAIVALESKRDLLETQKAHMAAQLGWDHPQIKAMIAESEELSHQLENKTLQIANQIHLDEIIARDFEENLRKKISLFGKDQTQSLSKIFNQLESKIKKITTQNKVVSEFSPLQNVNIHVIIPATIVPVSLMTLYGKSIVASMLGLMILLGGFLLFKQCFKTKNNQLKKADLKTSRNVFLSEKVKELETFITMEELSDFLKRRASTVISIIGSEAARTAAKLSLHLTKEHKTILLVDISGQQIKKVIGPHRGLSDILTGNAQLQDVIYRDYDTGVDILPQGLTSPAYAQNFSNNIPNILQEFKKEYNFIILEIASEPQYGFEQFAELTDYYICNAALNEQNWIMNMISKFPKTIYRVVAS